MSTFAEQWKERCRKMLLDEENPRVVEVVTDQLPYADRYNIVKRSTNGLTNKVVAIGFTLLEAEKWIDRKVNKAKEVNDGIIFYDIVNQDNKAALDPYWNPRPICFGEPI